MVGEASLTTFPEVVGEEMSHSWVVRMSRKDEPASVDRLELAPMQDQPGGGPCP